MDDDLLAFACPRCAREVDERFYGPCASCRTELGATQGGERRDIDAGRFEPSMNVTPNQVATKE